MSLRFILPETSCHKISWSWKPWHGRKIDNNNINPIFIIVLYPACILSCACSGSLDSSAIAVPTWRHWVPRKLSLALYHKVKDVLKAMSQKSTSNVLSAFDQFPLRNRQRKEPCYEKPTASVFWTICVMGSPFGKKKKSTEKSCHGLGGKLASAPFLGKVKAHWTLPCSPSTFPEDHLFASPFSVRDWQRCAM